MMGLEKMIAGMIGVTPEEMTKMIDDFRTMLSGLGETLGTIKDQNAEILTLLKEQSNVGSDSNRDAPSVGSGSASDPSGSDRSGSRRNGSRNSAGNSEG